MSAVESLRYIAPELILIGFSLAILFLGLFSRKNALHGVAGLTAVIIAGLFLPKGFSAGVPIFSNLITYDPFSLFFKEIFLVISFIVILISMGYRLIDEDNRAEFYFLILLTTVAMMFAVSSVNFIMIYVALEMISLVSYILVGFLKRDTLSNEAGVKYFLFGTLSTGIMLYGISFIYGLFGTTDISIVQSAMLSPGANNFAAYAALLLIFAGIAFKCSLVPFQMWAPDVYQGAPTPITAFISVGPKAVGFAVLIRVFMSNFSPVFPAWAGFFTVVSIATMTFGNIIAISQSNIKRMLAYSSIAQAGYILMGFVCGTPLGIKSVMFYLFVYALMNLGAFGCIVMISGSIKSDSIKHYAGLSKKDPASAFMLAMFLLSLAGIPPLAGFVGKFLLFAAVIEQRLVVLAVAAALNSVIAFYYYVHVIKCMYLDEPAVSDIGPKPFALKAALVIALIGILIVGILPGPFLNFIRSLISY